MRVTVLGGGSWGTTVASLAAHNASTTLWCRDAATADDVNTHHVNRRYLDGYPLHPDLSATTNLVSATASCDVLVVGVPSHAFRSTLEAAAVSIRPWVPIVSLTKGLERDTRLRMTEVANQVLPRHPAGALTGPNLAKEILTGDAAASVIAMADEVIAKALQQVFTTGLFRVYINDDVIGCELGGALKNVIAIASGMADGLGTGDNTRAAVITRGLNELTQLGVALGGQPTTFAGLAGMGDLLATCISGQSRNRHFGEQLGKGRTVADIAQEMDQVAEGVKSAPVVLEMARERNISMPITGAVVNVVNGKQSATDAYTGLLSRNLGREAVDVTAVNT